MLRYPIALVLATTMACVAAQGPARYSRVAIALDNTANDMRTLAALGLPVDHAQVGNGTCIVELARADIDRVRAQGFATEVLIADMSEWYRARAQEPAEDDRALGWLCDGPTDFGIPEHFNTGSMGGYLTWEEMQAELDEMVALYPELISAKAPIGETLEERPIHFVRISNAPNTDQDKPEVLYTAVHHAREPVSMSQLIYFMWWLLENYGTDAQATYLVDNRELYFVPCVNPDGYVYNQTTDPEGGGMWRKNRRDNGDGSFGVDLNRNYGFAWGIDDIGSSPDGFSEVYRGSLAFSEPETQAIRDFCNEHEFRAALNYHAFGDMVIHPWGHVPDPLTPDSALFTAQADHMTRNNGHSRGTAQQVLYYITNGSSDDWMYGEQTEKPKIQSMTPEVGQADEAFWPPTWRIVPICKENMDQNLLQAHLVGSCAVARDRSKPVFGQLDMDVPFEVQNLGLDPATFTVSIEPLENVVSVGAPKDFDDLDLLEARSDSIGITLSPSLSDGDRIRFILAVSNGGYTHRDTVERYFGVPTVVFADAGNDLSAWTNQNWGTSTEHFHSPPSSITDSPFGNYPMFEENRLVLEEAIDLSDATTATLRFWARWDISQIRDLVEVSASENGFNWTPLCGIHTRPGSFFQGNDEPVFEGRRYTWVQEEMSLDDHVGGDVFLRFRLISGMEYTRDGFYFDDLEVVTTSGTISGMGEVKPAEEGLRCWPDPANDLVTFRRPAGDHARLRIINASGSTVMDQPFIGRTLDVDVRHLPAGLYACCVDMENGSTTTVRLIVAH